MEVTLERTQENQRVMHVTGWNNDVTFDRKDPYGFWYVKFSKGGVPEILKQAFTTLDAAKLQVLQYLDGRKISMEQEDRERLAQVSKDRAKAKKLEAE